MDSSEAVLLSSAELRIELLQWRLMGRGTLLGDEVLHFMEKKIEDIERTHFSSQHKLTPHRKIILEEILVNSDRHLSAEDIYGLLRRKGIEIGLATIYRTLELFVELNILHKVDFDDGRSRYELTREERHRHHHLVCLGCGGVAEVEDDLLNMLEERIESKYGFQIKDHSVKFYGYCERCRSQGASEKR